MKASGIFSWPAAERRSDRYGLIGLWSANFGESVTVPVTMDTEELKQLCGKNIRIKARVIEARESAHIGDISRGIFPSKPNVGDVIDLGVGTFFAAYEGDTLVFGLAPDDDRKFDWFDPHKLYRLRDQTVELEFIDEG